MTIDQGKLEALMGRMVGDIGAAMSASLVQIGDQLGLYKALAAGPATADELAAKTKTSPRMVREWLLNQAASGYAEFDGATGRFSMTPEQAAVLADENGPAFMVGAFDVVASMHRDQPRVAEAFRDGKGLPWGAHDGCLFCGTERFFAAGYRANLLSSWIPALEGMQARLEQGAVVADVGCGHGASTILMAQAFPRSRFTGFDFHEPSIECAQKRARAAGLGNCRFEVADATNFAAPANGFDLIACFDCLHDMGDPVGCARHVHASLKKDGTWMVVEPAAGDKVQDNLNPVGRVFSAASTAVCVPASMASGGPALGACAGPARLTAVIMEGGFTNVRIATQTPFNHVYEARG